MKLVHETVIERSKIFQAFGAGFFQALEEEYLRAGLQLLKETAQLSHGITAGRDAENVMHEALDELLSQVLAGEVALWELARCEKLVEGYGLGSKWEGLLLMRSHADITSACYSETSRVDTRQLYWTP